MNDNPVGCVLQFISTCFRLFLPVAAVMGLSIIIAALLENLTNSPFLGIVAIVAIPTYIGYLVFRSIGQRGE